MHVRRKVVAGITTAALTAGLGITGISAAAAAPGAAAAVSVPTVSVTTVSTTTGAASPGSTATPGTASAVPTTLRGAAGTGTTDLGSRGSTTQAFWLRIAVRAALEVIKRTSRATYNTLMSYLNQGRAAFIRWWDTKAPAWVKKALTDIGIGITGAAIWDAIKFIVGW